MIRTLLKLRRFNRLGALAAGPDRVRLNKALEALENRLQAGRVPAPDPPPWLHASIMSRVREHAADLPVRSRRPILPPAWIVGSAGIALAFVVWLTMRPSEPEAAWKPGAVHADADALMRTAVSEGAVTLVEPLELELANLSRDLERTTEFLLASLP